MSSDFKTGGETQCTVTLRGWIYTRHLQLFETKRETDKLDGKQSN